jgi:hypothetical protein
VAGLIDLVGWGLEGPVDEHGAAEDVFAWDEAPVAAVEALGAVVAHGEDFARRNDEVVALDVVGEIERPEGGMGCARLFLNAGEIRGKSSRERI